MPEFSPLQTAVVLVLVAFFIVFYLRRSWFWFYKVTKLFKQFEEVEQTTVSTNREVKELSKQVSRLIELVEKQQGVTS